MVPLMNLRSLYQVMSGGILAVSTIVGVSSSAEARCYAYAGYYVTAPWGHEQNSAGTCNHDNHYEGSVYDDLSDGHCVAAAQKINGLWNYYQFYTCNSYGIGYGFDDSNSYTLMYIRWYDGGRYTPQVNNSTF